MTSAIYSFGEFQLDPGQFALLRNGHMVRLERKPLELLILLAGSEGRLVTRAEIAGSLWGKEVFVDTEHGINTAIRKLRAALRDSPERPRFVQTVTGIGYRFVAAMEIAQQVSPGTLPSTAEVPAPVEPSYPFPDAAPAQQKEGGRLPRSLAVFGIVALALGAWPISQHVLAMRKAQGSVREPIRSIAVLPLVNYSGDPKQDYFADGMTDELITGLARNSALRLPSRTSVMQYKGRGRSIAEVAQALGVDGVLEGSVSRSANQVHMNLQLIRANNDSHIWAESYDRDANDASLPDQAARSIAKILKSTVQTVEVPRAIAPAAHDAYLHGRYLWPTARMEESGAYFRKAVEIQPDYAEAWAGLANFYGEGIAGDVLDPRISMPLEEEAAQRALALAPHLAQVHQAVGAAYFLDRWDWNNADREFLLAISLDPNDAETYYVRACLLEALGRFPEAITLERRSMELDPFERRDALASILLEDRRYDEALADIRLRKETAPNDPGLLFTAADVWRRKGNYKEAMEAWAQWHVAMGDAESAAALRRAYALGGAHGFVRWQLGRRLLQAKSHYVSPVELASYYAQLGDKERALPLLEEGYRQRSTDMLWIQHDPAYDFLHGDERFRVLVREVGLPPAL